jgi:hypothetical protein
VGVCGILSFLLARSLKTVGGVEAKEHKVNTKSIYPESDSGLPPEPGELDFNSEVIDSDNLPIKESGKDIDILRNFTQASTSTLPTLRFPSVVDSEKAVITSRNASVVSNNKSDSPSSRRKSSGTMKRNFISVQKNTTSRLSIPSNAGGRQSRRQSSNRSRASLTSLVPGSENGVVDI